MHDKIRTSWCCWRDPFIGAGKPRDGAGGDLQSRLLRAVLSERELPEQGTGKSLHRKLSAPDRASDLLGQQCQLERPVGSPLCSGFWPADVAAGVVGGAV